MPGHRLQIGEHGDVYYARRGDRVTASLYYRSHDGRRRRIEATAATKTAARRKVLDILKRRLDSGTASYSSKATFGNLADEWLSHLDELVAVGRRSPSTVALYRHALERQVLPGIGQLRVTELTPARLDHFLHQKRREKGYATAKLCRAICSGVCGIAVRRGALVTNPVRDVSGLEVDRSREARALTVDESREWLAILDSDPLAVRKDLGGLARFLLGTGCRLGEAVGAHWADVDFDRHVLRVRRTVLRVKGQGLVAKAPKSRTGVRILRLPLWLVAALRERRGDAGDDSPIFPDARGGYRDGNNIEKDFRKVRAGTRFEWVVPHTYRKTVATMLDASGLSARVIADQLGHSRISMTQDIYMGRRAVDEAVATALEGVLPNPDNPDDDDSSGLRAVV